MNAILGISPFAGGGARGSRRTRAPRTRRSERNQFIAQTAVDAMRAYRRENDWLWGEAHQDASPGDRAA